MNPSDIMNNSSRPRSYFGNLQRFYRATAVHQAVFILLTVIALVSVGFESLGKGLFSFFMIFSAPLLLTERQTLFRDPMVKLLGLILIAQTLTWVNALYIHPEFAKDIPSLDRLAKLFSFVFIAYWLKGSTRAVLSLFAAFVAGVFIALAFAPDFHQDVMRALSGLRADFDIKNAQFTSMFAGVGMIICGFGLYWAATSRLKKTHKILLVIVNTLALAGLTWLLVVSQSRQAWLALLLAVVVLPIFLSFHSPRCRGKALVSIYLIIALLIGLFSTSSIVEKRISTENSVMATILNGDWQHIPMSSIGIRFNSWIEASHWISEHPILGSSSAAIKQVIQQSDKFTPELKAEFGHLHNFHIETLVSYGLVGLLLIYTMYYWLVRSIFIAQRERPELVSFSIFTMMFMMFWLVINFFETFSSRTFGVYTHNIIFGCLYTFYLASTLKKNHPV